MSALGRKPEPHEQILKPGIPVERSESWIHLEIVQSRSLLVGFFQMLERLIAVSQRQVNQRDIRFQACAPLGQLRQLVQESPGVRSLSSQRVAAREISQRISALPRQGPGLQEFGDGVLE